MKNIFSLNRNSVWNDVQELEDLYVKQKSNNWLVDRLITFSAYADLNFDR